MDENLFDLDDFESCDEDCEYLEEYDTDEEPEYKEKQDFNMGIFMTDTSDKSKEHLNLDWEDFSSDDYCKNKCEFYKTCYINREICLKKAFKEVLETLTPREEKVLKLCYGFNDEKSRTLDELSIIFGVTCGRVRQIKEKALRKLRHPSRAKMFINRKFDFYFAKTDFYRNLFDEIFGKYDNKTLVEIQLNLDYSIIDREKSFSKSISTIKSELETKICDIFELCPYAKALIKQNIHTLKELLYSSVEKILTAFDKDDYSFYSVQKIIENIGYRIKTTYYKSEREYFYDYYLEFVSFNLFSNLDNQDLINSPLPSGIVAKLLENNITTTSQLIELSKYQIREFINDDEKFENFFTIIKQYKPTISIGKYGIYNLYIDSKFISYFYWNLFDELHNNGYSIKALYKKIIDFKIDSFEKLIDIIEKDFSKTSVENLFGEYIVNKEILQMSIDDMDLSISSYNYLKRSNIFTVGDIINMTKNELLGERKLQKKIVDDIVAKLHTYGLKLKDE